MSRNTVRIASLLAALALLLLLVGALSLAGKASEEDLAKVRIGMDRAEVQDIMGRPDKDQPVRDVEDLCRIYAYKNVGRYKIVNISFDCDDKVQAIDKIS